MAEAKDISVANLEPKAEAKGLNDLTDLHELDEFDQLPEAPAAEAKPEAKPEVKPESKQEPTTYTHLSGMRRRAISLGATTEQIDRTSPEDLDSWVDFKEAEKVEKPEVKDEDAIDWGLDPATGEPIKEEDIHPSLVKNIKADRKKLRELEKKVEESSKSVKDREARQTFETIENAFDGLGEQYQKFLGSTDTELTPTEQKRRAAVFREAGVDFANLPSPKVLEKKLKAAAKELFDIAEAEKSGYEAAQASQKPLNGEDRISKETWAKAGLAAPTQKKSPKEKGPKAAMEAAQRWLREHPEAVPTDDTDVE